MANGPTDIFGRPEAAFNGAFAAGEALMTFTGLRKQGETVPMLVQQAAFNYTQQITMLFDLTSSFIYYVGGRAAGQGNINQILGPSRLAQAFLTMYGDVCLAGIHNLQFTLLSSVCQTGGSGVGNTQGSTKFERASDFTCKSVVVNGLSLQMTAEQVVIQQAVTMQFATMVYTNPPAATPTFTP